MPAPRRLSLLAFVLALAAALPTAAAPSGDATASSADSFVVVLNESVPSAAAVAAEHATLVGGSVTYTYEHALKGYAIHLSPDLVGLI
jgi:hypothetical protein